MTEYATYDHRSKEILRHVIELSLALKAKEGDAGQPLTFEFDLDFWADFEEIFENSREAENLWLAAFDANESSLAETLDSLVQEVLGPKNRYQFAVMTWPTHFELVETHFAGMPQENALKEVEDDYADQLFNIHLDSDTQFKDYVEQDPSNVLFKYLTSDPKVLFGTSQTPTKEEEMTKLVQSLDAVIDKKKAQRRNTVAGSVAVGVASVAALAIMAFKKRK